MTRLQQPEEEVIQVHSIEVHFGIPVYITAADQSLLQTIISNIARSRLNQFEEGVHWLAECGSKPCWSKKDAVFLGKSTSETAPDDGEPSFDDSILCFSTCAREFVSDEERERCKQRRTLRSKQ